jgi:hypothetical protein
VSVQRSQASVQRGQKAAYVVQVSTKNNGSVSGVTVALTTKPSSQKPAFTSDCAKGAGTATCTVSAVSDKKPVTLHVQVPIAPDSSSVTSVTLTATASVATTEKWTPPAAAETVAITAASASPSGSPTGSSGAGASPTGVSPGTTLPLGPIPNLNGVSSSLIGAGNASGLFPAINPATAPSPTPGVNAQGGKRNAQPVTGASPLAFAEPGLTGQVAGLIALAVAVLLTMTRLSLRKRFRSRKQGSLAGKQDS